MRSDLEMTLGTWMASVPVSAAAIADLRVIELPARRATGWWPRPVPAMATAMAAVAVVLIAALMLGPSVGRNNPVGGPPVNWQSSGDVGCTLEPVTGTLVDQNGRTALAGAVYQASGSPLTAINSATPDPVFVRWPAGWTVASGAEGLTVRNALGKVEAHTGEVVAVYAASKASPGMPDTVDGALLACPSGDVIEGGWPPSAAPSDQPAASESADASGMPVVVSQDGLTLTIHPPTVIEPGTDATFSIDLHNDRGVPAELADASCFGGLQITAPLPPDHGALPLEGAKAQFRSWMLAHAMGPGGVPALAPVVIDVISPPCTPSSNTSIAAGVTLHSIRTWPGDFARGFFVPPGPVSYSISIDYDPQNGPPSLAPGNTGIPPNWVPVYKHLVATGQTQIAQYDPVAVSPAAAVTVAIADARFWGFVSKQDTSKCEANLIPTESNGAILPAGPVWWIDVFCRSPRQFVSVAIDAYSGLVTGVDLCTDPCSR